MWELVLALLWAWDLAEEKEPKLEGLLAIM